MASRMFRETTVQDRPVEPEKRGWLRGRRLIAVVAVLIALSSIWIAPGISRLLGAGASVSLSRVTVATVTRGSFVRDVAADGKVVAAGSPTLYASAPGTVLLRVHAGDKVSKGQVLAQLASPDLTARSSQEHAVLEGAEVDYQRAQLDAKMQLMQAQDAEVRAQVDKDTAERELERGTKARELGAYSELQVLRAKDSLQKADFALQTAQKALAVRPAQNRFEVDSRKAAFERQQSLVEDLQRQLDALTVRSPVDGQIGRVQVADHAAVAKDNPLLTVIDLSSLEVEIQVPESFARDLAIGMAAELGGAGGAWRGKVSAVSPEVVNGQVTARVSFDGTAPTGLRQNQRLTVRIVLDKRDSAMTVDRGSFVDVDGGSVAYVVHNGTAEKRPVRLGTVGVGKVEVLSGLQEGDRVVVSGTEAFNGADRVILSN
jgi:HlyD family secretion protein